MDHVIGLKFKDHSSLDKRQQDCEKYSIKKKKQRLSPFCLLLHCSVSQSTLYLLQPASLPLLIYSGPYLSVVAAFVWERQIKYL